MTENISDKVKAVVSEKLGVPLEKVTDEARFIDDLGADSLDTVDLVMSLEDSFSIEITDEEAQKIQSVKDALSFIEKRCCKCGCANK
jgi:acyl carrier protein